MKILLLVSLIVGGCAASIPRHVIMAPDVFYVGVPQKIHVALFDVTSQYNVEVEIRVLLPPHPHWKTISSDRAVFSKDQPSGLLSLTVGLHNASEYLARGNNWQFFLLARIRDSHQTFTTTSVKVAVSYSDGIVLIQTDKPIYSPDQRVKIHVVPLGFNLMPSTKKINLVIKNPQGIRVRQWNNLSSDSGFISQILNMGTNAMVGNWTVEGYYGHLFVYNTSKTFEVREYILPKFSVTIKGPDYIKSDSSSLKVSIKANYTYGKTVEGTVSVRLYVVGILKEPRHLYSFRSLLRKGTFKFDIKVENIKKLLEDKWFPAIEGHRLQITADVTEKSTGKTETAVDDSIYFVVSPYRIKYIDTARYFMPGLPFQVKVKVTYPNKKIAVGVNLVRTTKTLDENGKDLVSRSYVNKKAADEQTNAATDKNGIAIFITNVPSQARKLTINVNTSDMTINKSQNAYKTLVVEASQSDELMKLKQNKPAKVGENAACEAIISSKSVDRLSYFVVSRGQIVYNQKIDASVGIVTTLSFKVTPLMSPSARIVAYYVSKVTGKIVSDSILLDIEDTFSNQILLPPDGNEKELPPGHLYNLKILGAVGTKVRLLAVDQSVYLLSKINLLTQESVFKKLEQFDLGCGAGGGINAEDVFENAGMVVISHDMVLPTKERGKCESEPRRTKRSITRMQEHMDFCCNLGNKTDPNKRNCYRRVMDLDVAILKDKELIHDCKAKYLNCCITAFGLRDVGILARSGQSEIIGDFENDEEGHTNPNIRQFFPETWLNKELTISPISDEAKREKNDCTKLRRDAQDKCGLKVFPVSLPDTMTTWVVQAIGVSNTTGFGIAKPLHITTFKPFFIHLSMPYSVQRGEEITILATLFNYKKYDISVYLYLKGDKSFCSVAQPGKTSRLTSNKIKVKAESSVSYAINLLPIKFGEIPIEVTAKGLLDDRVLKKLLVVPEGVEEILTQSYVLDPKEFFKGRREQGEKQQNDAEKLSFQSEQAHNTSRSEQVDKILLKISKKAIPESVDAKVYLTGNMIGQAVTNIAVGQLKHLLSLPGGCGEQNMNRVGPNVYALHYLQATNQMTKEMESKKIKYIQEGYAHELDYRQEDGSFAYFSKSNRAGSTWLTAFVVKVFCQAREIKRIDIDKGLLCESVNWLLKQKRNDGAFIEGYKAGGGGLSGEIVEYTIAKEITLTAFVLIALKQCQCGGYLEEKTVQKATALLEGRVSNLTDAYALALTTYALALVDSSEKIRANRRLVEMATFNPATTTRYWETGSRTRNIKTAAYALLAQVALNRLEYAGPIVVWLTKQRGPKGGFLSTTDTTVALEALSKYSELANVNKLDMKVWIKNNSKKLNKDTALLQQEVDIKLYIDKELMVETRGTGVGQLQINVKYNVPSKKKDRCDFHLSIKITEDENGKLVSKTESDGHPRTRRATRGRKRKGKKNKRKRKRGKKRPTNRRTGNKKPTEKPLQKHEIPKKLIVTICARLKKRGTTGMAIIDAGILTGYSVIEESLAKLVKKENNSIERYELSDRAVVFYLDGIDNVKPLCVAFGVFRDFHVGGIQPVPVKVYDYYEPDDSCTVFYNLGPSSKSVGKCKDTGICKCTQGKCPLANPSLGNIGRLKKRICKHFDYAIKGQVVLIDEDNTWLTYDVQVITVLKQPGKDIQLINATNVIEFRKQASCESPHLWMKETVFIMGQIKHGLYVLNDDAFVKKLDKNEEEYVDKLAARIKRRGCGS